MYIKAVKIALDAKFISATFVTDKPAAEKADAHINKLLSSLIICTFSIINIDIKTSITHITILVIACLIVCKSIFL